MLPETFIVGIVHVFPMFPTFAIQETLFPASIFVFKTHNAFAAQQRILTKIQAYEQLQKFFGEHEQASTHPFFVSNLRIRQNFDTTEIKQGLHPSLFHPSSSHPCFQTKKVEIF